MTAARKPGRPALHGAKMVSVHMRMPANIVEGLRALAENEQARTGLPVNVSAVVRRALEDDLRRRGGAA
jgi:Arc/MetJ-type ribon-helix-helix transcriptional regulator